MDRRKLKIILINNEDIHRSLSFHQNLLELTPYFSTNKPVVSCLGELYKYASETQKSVVLESFIKN
jgi:hypothetical protein